MNTASNSDVGIEQCLIRAELDILELISRQLETNSKDPALSHQCMRSLTCMVARKGGLQATIPRRTVRLFNAAMTLAAYGYKKARLPPALFPIRMNETLPPFAFRLSPFAFRLPPYILAPCPIREEP
jgi:hypothetical protein